MLSHWYPRVKRNHGARGPEKARGLTTTVTISSDGEDTHLEAEPSITHWNPIWLHAGVILGVVFASTSTVAVLLLFMFLSRKDDGLALHTTNHFSWTYGPTAVLTIFAAV